MGSEMSSFKEAETYKESPIPDDIIKKIHKHSDSFWKEGKSLPLYSHGITAWKFLTILHKISWLSSNDFIKASHKEIQTIKNVGNSWVVIHNYGQLNNQFSKYLIDLLNFYKDLPFPQARSDFSFTDLKKLIGDSNQGWVTQFGLILDLLDSNIAFQREILKWMKNLGLNAKTPESQCRIAPLALCLIEADQLRQIAVQIWSTVPVVRSAKDYSSRCKKQHEQLEKYFMRAEKFDFISNALPSGVKDRFKTGQYEFPQ